MLKTNKDRLIVTAVQAVVQPSGSRGYGSTWEGKAKVTLGTASINYTVSIGDPVWGYAAADHVEPDVTVQGRDKPSASDCAIAILACIGNEANVVSGDAKGANGIYIGRHAGADDLVWFDREILDDLALDDKIQVKACGCGLQIEGFEDVKLNKMSPRLLEGMGVTVEEDQLVVPVVAEIPGWILGAGVGWDASVEVVDYDIQTTCPEVVEELKLKELKLGDVIAIPDHYDAWGRGRYEGAVTIGVIIHGFSSSGGHGPGVNPIMAALPGRLMTKMDPDANIAYYLGIRERPKKK